MLKQMRTVPSVGPVFLKVCNSSKRIMVVVDHKPLRMFLINLLMESPITATLFCWLIAMSLQSNAYCAGIVRHCYSQAQHQLVA